MGGLNDQLSHLGRLLARQYHWAELLEKASCSVQSLNPVYNLEADTSLSGSTIY